MILSAKSSAVCRDIVRDSKVAGAAGTLHRLDPLETPGWDGRIATFGEASIFHSAGWAGVLHGTYGHTPHYFCVVNGGKLSAVLPLMEVESRLTGKRGVSLPFTDECGVLSDGNSPCRDLLQDAIEFGRGRKWRYLECRGIAELPVGVASPSLSFHGHALRLGDPEDRIFSRLESSARRGIRKAEKSGVRVEVLQTLASVRVFYLLHCKTRMKHGLPPQSSAFFRSIFEHVLSKGLGFVALASYQGKPIAAALFLHFGEKAIYKFGASEAAFQNLRGSSLVMWEAIKWYSCRGYKSLSFGRTSIANEGLRRFKLGFGTEEYRIDHVKYDFARDAFVADRDKVFGWHNLVFRWMPVPLSRTIGRVLYKHLS